MDIRQSVGLVIQSVWVRFIIDFQTHSDFETRSPACSSVGWIFSSCSIDFRFSIFDFRLSTHTGWSVSMSLSSLLLSFICLCVFFILCQPACSSVGWIFSSCSIEFRFSIFDFPLHVWLVSQFEFVLFFVVVF
jgi:hypothetical protein